MVPDPIASTRISGTARMSVPFVRICAKPSAMPKVPSVTMSGGMRAAATRTPLTAPQKAPLSERNNEPDENDAPSALGRAVGSAGRARHAQHDLSGRDRGEDENRADGEVDPAGDDHEGLPDRENEKNRRVDGEHRQIEARPELLRAQCREDRDQRDQQNENPPPAKKLGPALQRRDSFVVRFAQRGCAHAARSSTDPLVIAATRRSTLASCAENRATRRPRRRTSIRSATAST